MKGIKKERLGIRGMEEENSLEERNIEVRSKREVI